MFVALNPAAGDHAYELPPIAVVPIVALVVVQSKFCVEPASAVGAVLLTVTVTSSVQRPFTVSVYVVVIKELAVGCAIFGSFKPVAGDQEYVLPGTEAVPIEPDGVLQSNDIFVPASAIHSENPKS